MPSADSEPGEDAAETPPSLVYVIGRVSQGVRRELGHRLAELDLSVPEFTALSVLERRPGLSSSQLARRSLITPQSMSQVVASLESRRLIRRTVDPSHARILRAELTALGARRLEHAHAIAATVQDELLAGVSPGDRDVVLRSLTTAMDALSERGAGERPAR